jgi:acyl-CoA synthetase (AMP-forming)/AMP-acid ligase II
MAGTGREFIPTFERITKERGNHPALVLLQNFEPGIAPGERGPGLTYTELGTRARRMAAGLTANGMRGERVLLLHPAGLEFTVAMLACIYSGAIAVPAPPPTAFGRGVARLAGIVEDAGVACVVADTTIADPVRMWLADSGLNERLRCLTEPELDGGDGAGPAGDVPGPESTAFLQYTSGSTSEPKGVVVSNRALAHNLVQIGKVLRLEPGFRSVSWLPHYHDMGLVGQLLTSLYHGGTVHLMSPTTFLKRPYQWLAMVSELRVRFTTGPNFAYELVTNRTTDAQLATLDLSSLDAALNGSEPIHEATLSRFAAKFGPAGLRPQALMPCYGMAESTLMVSATPLGTERVARFVDTGELERHRFVPATDGGAARPVVSSGRPVDLDVRIVDPDTREELPENRVGEIWIAGESVADGYWGRSDATAATFGARLADGAGSDATYLRTGDLGALADGELFVTGRIKEVLVLNGRNHYPQDLERTVRAAHSALAANQTAVFAAPFGETAERAVAVQEVRPADLRTLDPAELAGLVRRKVWLEHEVQLGDVVFVPRGSVPRTTSGKIRRGQVRDLFLGGGLPVLTPAGDQG